MANNIKDNKDKKGVLSEKAIERIAKKNILEKNDKYMRILAKKKKGEKLKKNELILPYPERTKGEIQKLIWFNLDEEMIYDERYGMELPECYYNHIQQIRTILGQQDEDKNNRQPIYVKAQPNNSKYVQQQRELRKRNIEFNMPKIKERHIKIREQIIRELQQENNKPIQEQFQVYLLNREVFGGEEYIEGVTEEEVLRAIRDVPLYTEDVEWFFTIHNRHKIVQQIRDNRKLDMGEVTTECFEYCLKVDIGEVEQYCIVNNYRAIMKQKGVEEVHLPAIYQVNKYRGCK